MYRARIGLFLIYWGVVALLIFAATMVNNRPEACPLLLGVGLAVLGLLMRLTAKPAAPPPAAPAPAPGPAATRKPLFGLPGPKKAAPPAPRPAPAPPPRPEGLKAVFKLPGKKK